MSKSLIIEGIPSGDGESFCIEVTEEVFKYVCGDELYKLYLEEEKWRKADHTLYGHKNKEYKPAPFRIYPCDIIAALGEEIYSNKKLKVKIELLEE